MKLSVIIVNYNVRNFLEQCLFALEKAIKNINAEIFVVDNNSVDGSCAMVRKKFPHIPLIENKKNNGFSFACNQAIRISKGEYILLINPDTVVEEDTLKKSIGFMDSHPDSGGLGVKMIDGKGNFLPESKRALPTPGVAFYKIFGLSKLFPKSKIFGKYHLGYLDREEIHEVEILPGAFMLLRKKALDKIGLLDEDFFMYGEDIDLSYRLLKEGYKNYYFPKTTIIHYKGESTKKGSINYVLLFYKAMIIFARKHFSKKNATLLSILINVAIYFRAILAILKRFFNKIFLPLFDTVIIYFGYLIIIPHWEKFRFPNGGTYPKEFIQYVVPAYIIIWLTSIFSTGGYEKPVKLFNVIKGILTGTLFIIIIYALLPEYLRFSRALILFGAILAIFSLLIIRIILHLLNLKAFKLELNKKKRIVIVGNEKESSRVYSVLKQSQIKPDLIGFVNPESKKHSNHFIGNVEQIKEIVSINKIEEIIFCAKDIPAQKIIKNMLKLSDIQVYYKIAPPESFSVIGSNSINTAGDFYEINFNSIAKRINKYKKRLLDIFLSIIFIFFSPILILIVKYFKRIFKNSFKVLIGRYSWIGYHDTPPVNTENLPTLKKGIITPIDAIDRKNLTIDEIERANMIYAKDYKIFNDLTILLKAIRYLGK